jgi:cytidylate kinase
MKTCELVITIAQEEGSAGREIAQQLARTLQLNFVDEAVIRLATENMSHTEIENYIKDLAGRGRVIILGCGANFMLRDFEGVINILIRAPFTQRLENLMNSQHLDRTTAERRLYLLDSRYSSYIRQHYGPEWTNDDLYDLTLNTKTMPVSSLVVSLARFIQTLYQSQQPSSTGAEPFASLRPKVSRDTLEKNHQVAHILR